MSSAAGAISPRLTDEEAAKRQAEEDERKKTALYNKTVTSALKKIEESEKARLKILLQTRLKESGWHDEMADYCREVIRNKSLEHLDISELVNEIAPRSRASVPDAIREQIASKITAFLDRPSK